ncbi:DUF389 domain-containing protein [Chryseobacterium sp. HSC-36S06]|uniref:DUF389 domain-containing protein n=1 Tax=Chryseobacterium sp. HSC-36S06 TaxID=2910970 RepID=UPI0020A06055|nr:DUF389 domain-containing protein [Chryseobacterium sp. HSC-36S06]MCP2038815.1 putative hydrophobic protein (TIGR00271 family) [Chryseobacterium sp. HSC-36S06]
MSNPFLDFINLHNGEEDKKKVLENVTASISFRGSNFWILACAIIIASVGLNVNSTAVIIGAMLISPLMGPIVGAGMALGTYDFVLLKKSVKNLFIATVVGLLVSALYFFVSPFKEVQSELLSRTAPNIYDVLIAFFGGLVGVIAITRVEKGNPIPGVAIATALMPPLCTAGYGIATFNLSYFAGAFYLYTINCFFICIATFLVIKYLKYPTATVIEKKREQKIRNGITALIIIMVVPSFYLAYNLYNEKKFVKTAEDFISTEFGNKGYTLIYKKLNYQSLPKTIDIAFLTKKFTPAEIEQFNKKLLAAGLTGTKLNIKQNGLNLQSEMMDDPRASKNEVGEKDIIISSLSSEISRYKVEDATLMQEMKILFPELETVSVAKTQQLVKADSTASQIILVYTAEKSVDTEKLRNWLSARLGENNTVIVAEQQ